MTISFCEISPNGECFFQSGKKLVLFGFSHQISKKIFFIFFIFLLDSILSSSKSPKLYKDVRFFFTFIFSYCQIW